MSLCALTTTLAGGCGVNVLYNFAFCNPIAGNLNSPDLKRNLKLGVGITIANFVDKEVCKDMYKKLSSRYLILYQSPVRRNSRTGRQGFFVVFDTSAKKGS